MAVIVNHQSTINYDISAPPTITHSTWTVITQNNLSKHNSNCSATLQTGTIKLHATYSTSHSFHNHVELQGVLLYLTVERYVSKTEPTWLK